jgi:replicative DNA helicase
MKKKTQKPIRKKSAPGLSWGFPSLDRQTCGLQPGQLLVFSAYPGVGKTTFALNVVEHLALQERAQVGMISLEMTTKQLLVRLACSHAQIDLLQLYLGKGSEKNQEKFSLALAEIAKAPFQIFATPRINLPDLQTEARRLQERCKIKLLIIDCLHLISADGLPPNKDPDREKAKVLQGIKSMAGELKIPVLLLNLLTTPENEKKKKAKDSKILEKVADVVCELAPHDAYEEQKGKAMETITAQVALVKNKNGSKGNVRLKFLPKITRFE